MKRQSRGEMWAVVLAGGEGSRLAPLVRGLYGWDMPKQFAALDGEKTMLQRTMDRIAPLVPPERTVIVITETHEPLARAQLADYKGVILVSQPLNLGTGPGILLPITEILARDRNARVAVFPSDHHIRREAPFIEAVHRADELADLAGSGVSIVGAAPERAAADLGWIVPGRRLRGRSGWEVHRFVEKPAEPMAMYLISLHGLWNTMVLAGRASALWALGRKHLPQQARELARYLRAVGRPSAAKTLANVYRNLLPADFSREVLERAHGLGVVPMIDSGWADCGTPERLLACLDKAPHDAGDLEHLARVRYVARAAARPTQAPAHAAA